MLYTCYTYMLYTSLYTVCLVLYAYVLFTYIYSHMLYREMQHTHDQQRGQEHQDHHQQHLYTTQGQGVNMFHPMLHPHPQLGNGHSHYIQGGQGQGLGQDRIASPDTELLVNQLLS